MPQTISTAGGCSTTALLQRFVHVAAQSAERRSNPNSTPVRQETAGQKRTRGHPSGSNRAGAAAVHGIHENGTAGAYSRRRAQSGRAARERQQDALGKQLPRDATACCTQRAPNGEFLLPRRAAGQQQIRDVHAGNQKHERHRASRVSSVDECPPSRSRHRFHGGAHVRVVLGILLLERGSQGFHLRSRLLHAHAGFQPAMAK